MLRQHSPWDDGADYGCGHGPFDDWKVVGAFGAAGILALLGVVGLVLSVSPRDLSFAREWRDQRWQQLACTVEDVGVAYRGNCDTDVELAMTQFTSFKECRGPSETVHNEAVERKSWDAMAAGRCAEHGDRDFWYDTGHTGGEEESPEELEEEEEEEWRHGRRLFAPPLERKLFGPLTQSIERIRCHNAYLLWAAVQVPLLNASLPSSHGCAFEYGASAPSVSDDWAGVRAMMDTLQAAYQRRDSIACWVLDDDACVVAFRSEHALANEERLEQGRMFSGASFCGLFSLMFLMLALYWRPSVVMLIFGESQHWTHAALPTDDPSELELHGANSADASPQSSAPYAASTTV